MKYQGHKIMAVTPGSIAEELELEPGDVLLTIDGEELEDIFDYDYMTDAESFVMVVRKANGEEWELEIESGGEDLGLTFENGLMSDYKSCSVLCQIIVPVQISASSALSTRCRRECVRRSTLRTTTPDFRSFRETTSP